MTDRIPIITHTPIAYLKFYGYFTLVYALMITPAAIKTARWQKVTMTIVIKDL
jgi:hypothetical protein